MMIKFIRNFMLLILLLGILSNTCLSQRKIGLALSGGAALGFSHIGALQVLEEHGIAVEIVTGTSMGAIIGALYAGDMHPEEIVNLISEIKWREFLVDISFLDLGLFSIDTLQNVISGAISVDDFSSLSKKLGVVATDLNSGEMVLLTDGSVSKAVAASAAIPVIFSPVEHEGRLLVDGGLTNNIPNEQARELGADIVIAVNVNSVYRYTDEPENKYEVGIRAYNIAMMYHSDASDADVVIAPDLSGLTGTDLDSFSEFILRGRQATEQVMPEILSLLDEI